MEGDSRLGSIRFYLVLRMGGGKEFGEATGDGIREHFLSAEVTIEPQNGKSRS